MSPIFPYITDFKKIIDISADYIDEYWFENLNLRGAYKQVIFNYIEDKYPDLLDKYNEIYNNNNNNNNNNKEYWKKLSQQIEEYCKTNNIKYINYFYHEELVKNK